MGLAELKAFWREHPAAAAAFSGGVDSGAVLASAVEAGVRVGAYFVKSAFQPDFELDGARAAAAALGVPLTVLPVSVLDCPAVAANGPDRCYHCKRLILTAIRERAAAEGFPILVDGTNADDDPSDRPGSRALAEMGVLSPLRLCGVGKREARSIARRAGLPNWNRPAYACLATRIPTGTPLCAEELSRVEQAEGFLFDRGFSDFRVRRIPGGAKLQLREDQFARAVSLREELAEGLRPLVGTVLLDLTPRPAENAARDVPLRRETVCELRCNVDDMTGEEAAFAVERLMEGGALDAWTQPITMKKGRPALLFGCLCRPEDETEMTALLLRHTTTLGVRRNLCERSALARTEDRRGPARVKVSEGGGVRREKAEFDDIAALARREGLSLREVRKKYGL